jgi:hypothetical protein
LRALVLLAEDEQCAQDIVLSSRIVSVLCRFVLEGGGDAEKKTLFEDLDVLEQASRLVQVLALTGEGAVSSWPSLASELVDQGAIDMLFAVAGSRGFSDGRTKQQACLSLSGVLGSLSRSKAQHSPLIPRGKGRSAEWLARFSSSLPGHGTESGVLEECLASFLQYMEYMVHDVRTGRGEDLRGGGPGDALAVAVNFVDVAVNIVAAINTLLLRPAR